jgi:hypothetical protein
MIIKEPSFADRESHLEQARKNARQYANASLGLGIGAVAGTGLAAIGAHLWTKQERNKITQLNTEFVNSLSRVQKPMFERLEELDHIITTSSDGAQSIGLAFGPIGGAIASGASSMINAKYIAEANLLGKKFRDTYTKRQSELESEMSRLTNTGGLKTLGVMLVGIAGGMVAGYYIGKSFK